MALRARGAPPAILVALLAAVLAACGPAADAGSASPPVADATASPPTATATPEPSAAFPLTLTDDAGRSVTLAAAPRRIVSLAPSNTEIACAVDACDALVGVTDFDDYPTQVTAVEHVVVGAQVDVEKVVAAEPDLVLAAGNGITPDDVIAQLDDLGLTVMVLYPQTLDEIYADIELVGDAVHNATVAEAQLSRMRDEVAAVTDAVAGAHAPRVFYEVGLFEGQIYTAGEDSFLASLIELAGGDPITGDAVTTSIAEEDLIAADPEVILLGDGAYDTTITRDTVVARPGWAALSAVEHDRISVVTEDVVITRPGPRVTDGLAALARAIHPEIFSR